MAYQSQDIIRRSATNGFTPAPQARDHQQEVAKLIDVTMENKLSYFTFHWPIHVTVGVTFSLVLINVMVTHFIYKKR